MKLWLNVSLAGVVIFEHLYWPQLIFKWEKAVVFQHLGSLSAVFSLFTLCKQVPHSAVQNSGLLVNQGVGPLLLSERERERLNNRSEMTVLRSSASFFMQENSHWNAWRCPWFLVNANSTLKLGSPCFRDKKKWGCCGLLSLTQSPSSHWIPVDPCRLYCEAGCF